MNQSIKSRIAPTPSGLLHLGNAYNFLIVYRETVLKRQGELMLRIDDSDSARIRDEFIQDIFDTLKWLEIPYGSGPIDIEDFKNNYSQSLKKKKYFAALNNIPNTYVCKCSRTFLKENHCPCIKEELIYSPGNNAIKILVDDLEIKEDMGDFILWRKDDLPSYQLASLIDDIDNGINLIIRGEDLLNSTKAQFLLAELMGDKVFTHAHFIHHPIIKNKQNDKISKSQGDGNISELSLKHWREQGKDKLDVLSYFGFKSWEEFINE